MRYIALLRYQYGLAYIMYSCTNVLRLSRLPHPPRIASLGLLNVSITLKLNLYQGTYHSKAQNTARLG